MMVASISIILGSLCSNRTFMELKCTSRKSFADKNTGSNRTFMELK